ncbi:MAG: fused MFS/spermidine synthase [Gemmatimonadota bacterium]
MTGPTKRAPAPRSHAARLGGLVLAAALLAAAGWVLARYTPDTIFEREGPFGRVRVVERHDGLRSLFIGAGRARQSALYPARPRHLEFPYTKLGMVGLALTPPDGRILFVGLGGGAMPSYTRAVLPAARIDVVEIDPLVVEVAQRFFGFRPDERMAVHTMDGRAFIEGAPAGSWDLIVLDAYSDDFIPYDLSTRQFLEAVRTRLGPGGVVVSNLWSSNRAYPAMVATYAAVFAQVRLLHVPGRNQRILVAGGGGVPLDREALVAAAEALDARSPLGFDLAAMVEAGWEGRPHVHAPVLEDTS